MPFRASHRHWQGVARSVVSAAVLLLLPVATSAQRVVATYSHVFQPPVTQAYDLATERLEMGASPMTHMTARGDGSQVVVIRQRPFQEPEFALVDTVSGMTLATTLFPPPPVPVTAPCGAQLAGVSPDRHTVVATCRWSLQSRVPGLSTLIYRT